MSHILFFVSEDSNDVAFLKRVCRNCVFPYIYFDIFKSNSTFYKIFSIVCLINYNNFGGFLAGRAFFLILDGGRLAATGLEDFLTVSNDPLEYLACTSPDCRRGLRSDCDCRRGPTFLGMSS